VETVTTNKGWFWKSAKVEVRELDGRERGQRLRRAKERLRKLKLLANPNPNDPHELDAHPIVRAYFAGRLVQTAPEAARTAHDILYRHYAAAAPDLPDTLEKMQPLFHAVQHGLRAGKVEEVFYDIYIRRIRRGADSHLGQGLGAYGAFLTVVSQFFRKPWLELNPELSKRIQAYMLTEASYALRAVGRLKQSIPPREAALLMLREDGDYEACANVGEMLSLSLLSIGEVGRAVETAAHAVDDAKSSGDTFRMECSLRIQANALLCANELVLSRKLFKQAEESAGLPLISLRGYQFGDLLLELGEVDEAVRRGEYHLQRAEAATGEAFSLNDIALAWLLLARSKDSLGHTDAERATNCAVESFREAGREDYLPLALLTRAAHRRRRSAAGETDLIDGILTDLAEVENIAGEEMRLYLTDLALERARLALDVPTAFASPEAARAEAETQTALAATLITETGYYRRDGELAELHVRLKHA
jgi:hypothetical protein